MTKLLLALGWLLATIEETGGAAVTAEGTFEGAVFPTFDFFVAGSRISESYSLSISDAVVGKLWRLRGAVGWLAAAALLLSLVLESCS